MTGSIPSYFDNHSIVELAGKGLAQFQVSVWNEALGQPQTLEVAGAIILLLFTYWAFEKLRNRK